MTRQGKEQDARRNRAHTEHSLSCRVCGQRSFEQAPYETAAGSSRVSKNSARSRVGFTTETLTFGPTPKEDTDADSRRQGGCPKAGDSRMHYKKHDGPVGHGAAQYIPRREPRRLARQRAHKTELHPTLAFPRLERLQSWSSSTISCAMGVPPPYCIIVRGV